MERMKGLRLLFIILVAVFIASCAKQPVIPGVPVNLRATALVGVVGVELRWDAVNGAVSYDVVITKQAVSGSRETFGPYNTTNTYYLATRDILGSGDFDWNVSAVNTAGASDPAEGVEFTLTAYPGPEPEYGLVLTLEEKPAPFSDRDTTPTIHVYGGHENNASGQRGYSSDFLAFNYILGTLRYMELLSLEGERQNMSVQLMVEPIGGGEAKRWPDSDTEFLLDEEGQLVVGINNLGENYDGKKSLGRDPAEDPLEPGQYYFWARAAWDNEIQSTKERFDIVLMEEPLTGSILLRDGEGKVYTTKVCPTSTEVTLVYEVSAEGGEWFRELCYHFTIAQQGEDGAIETTESGAFTGATAFSTTVTYATECTKYATLTLDGTLVIYIYDDEEATEVTYALNTEDNVVASRSFVLDMADPTATVTIDQPFVSEWETPASITTATITFLASDTKCLQPYDEKITFLVQIHKGMGSWEAIFAYGEPVIILGQDSPWGNELTINATYQASKTTYDNAIITLVLNMKKLDWAVIEAFMMVFDCCCDECTVEDPCVNCGVGGNLIHLIGVQTRLFVDNAFFSGMLLEKDGIDSLLTLEGFPSEEEATPTIPATPGAATLTVKFADAFWSESSWKLTEWAFYNPDGIEFITEGYLFFDPEIEGYETIYGICSGYYEKTQVTFVGTMTVDPESATETILTMVATAVDKTGNQFVLNYDFLFDTIAPTLTHFTAFRNQILNSSYIEFKFDQKPESFDLVLTVNGSEEFFYDEEDAIWNGTVWQMPTGVTLPVDSVVTLGATVTDLAGNVGFSTKQATVSLSSSR